MAEKGEGSLSMEEKRIVQLKSSDGEIFEVDEVVVLQSQMLKDFIELDTQQALRITGKVTDAPFGAPFPLPQVSSKILTKVIEYCNYHFESQQTTAGKQTASEKEIKAWDANFVKVDLAILYDILLAASYLEINDLMVLTAKSVYNLKAKERTPEEICKTFCFREDFTPEESEQMRSGEDAWAFDEYNENFKASTHLRL